MSTPSDALSDDLLRAAFSSAPEASDGPDDATTNAIWRAVRGECTAEELGALLRRVREEPELAETWRMAQAIHAEVVAPEEQAAEQAPPPPQGKVLQGPASWWRQPKVLGIGAVVAMAAAALLFVTPGPDPGGGPMRAETVELANLLGDAELARDNAVLRWTPAEQGTVYSITVTTDYLASVARVGGIHEAEWQIPAESLKSVPAGTQLLWSVHATLPDGTKHRSGTFVTVLR